MSMTYFRCWLCGQSGSAECHRGEARFLRGIPGAYLVSPETRHDKKGKPFQPGIHCAKCGSKAFAPADGSLAPVLGWDAIRTRPEQPTRYHGASESDLVRRLRRVVLELEAILSAAQPATEEVAS